MPVHTDTTPRSDTPCHHCGLPVGTTPVGSGPYFCCSGCETVFHILGESGYADYYYRLKGESKSIGESCPAPVEPDTLLLAELDTPEFLSDHTERVTDSIRRVRLYLDGVHCAACVWLIERMPFELEGVESTRLDLPRGMVTVEWDEQRITLSRIGRWLFRIGYPIQPRVQSRAEASRVEEKKLLVRVGICWALAGNVMLIAFALYSGLAASNDPGLFRAARIVSLLLSIPAVIIGGGVFFRRAWASVRFAWHQKSVRNLHMDTPISLGILVGFGSSTISAISGRGEIWFDSVTILIAALLSARWIQLRSRRLAGDQTDRLLALIPTMARRVDENDSVTLVRAASLIEGDQVEVPPGEIIPVDGTVISGSTHLNNAVLTGESLPERIGEGDSVFAGATNVSSPVRVSVVNSGDETRIGQLLSWISDDASRRAPVVMMADRIGGFFVITVLVLGFITLFGWLSVGSEQAVHHMVALLVITCPCALGMATPLALAVATGRAARRGLFVKQEAVFETLTHVDAVVLDKTGTLTEGHMQVSAYEGDREAITWAAQIEASSTHPVAMAITAFASTNGKPSSLDEVRYEVGHGMEGLIDGRRVRVGKLDWIVAGEAGISKRYRAFESNAALTGATPVGVSVNDELRAIMSIEDRIRPDAERLVEKFRSEGMQLYVASGDHLVTVRHVASELGIDPEHVFGRASPDDKLALVNRLVGEGSTVAMVGDGVNDASALQSAHVGIAVSGSSGAGKLAADVFITGRGIDAVTSLIGGSRRVMRTIRRNLSISLAYNIVGAGLAMAGVVTPLIAAIAMPISSFTVVLFSVLQHPFRSV